MRTSNILVVGDIHAPFEHKDYLDFNKDLYKRYQCNKVIMIGDLIDFAAISYHDHDPDMLSPGDELDTAIAHLQPWYKAFPHATVCLGNHDLRLAKRCFKSGVSKRWIRDYGEVIGSPGWVFVDEITINKVLYTHGSTGDAYKRCQQERISVVQGHYHTKAGIEYYAARGGTIFGCQTGCGIDDNALAFAYAKQNAKKSILASAVVLNQGKLPIVELLC